MSMAPETAVSPMSEAPDDRPTADLEQLLRQVIAIIFGDRVMDPAEQRTLRSFMEEVALRAQAGGGIGQGGTPGTEPQQSPMEMNANGAEDMGTVEGAAPEEGY